MLSIWQIKNMATLLLTQKFSDIIFREKNNVNLRNCQSILAERKMSLRQFAYSKLASFDVLWLTVLREIKRESTLTDQKN